MPLPRSDCDISGDVCCTSIYDAISAVVGVAHAGVVACLGEALCDSVTGYVSIAQPNNPTGDYVAGWMVSMDARAGANAAQQGMMLVVPTLTIGIRLMETGYPMVNEGGGGTVPSFNQLNAISLHAYSHAEMMYRRVLNALVTRQISCCGFQAIGPLVPVEPSGGLVGYQFTVTVTLDLR